MDKHTTSLQELFAPLEKHHILEEYVATADGARASRHYSFHWQNGTYQWCVGNKKGSGAFYGFIKDQQDELLHQVAARKDEFRDKAFFAVADGSITLNIIANGEFKAGVLSGIDPCQRNLWRDVFECVRESGGDRRKVPELFERFGGEQYKGDLNHFTGYSARHFADCMRKDLDRPESWLAPTRILHIFTSWCLKAIWSRWWQTGWTRTATRPWARSLKKSHRWG